MAVISESNQQRPAPLKVGGLAASSSAYDTSEHGQAYAVVPSPQVTRPGQIPGSDTFSVFRHRKHKLSTKFELFEPKLGTHLSAKLEKASGATTYAISDWRQGETVGWLCCNAKGDTFVFYENVDTGLASGPEPAATLALAWKLSSEESRRVDVIKLAPDHYKPLSPAQVYGAIEVPAIDDHLSSVDASPISIDGSSVLDTSTTTEGSESPDMKKPSGLLERRRGKGLSLAVSVPEEITGIPAPEKADVPTKDAPMASTVSNRNQGTSPNSGKPLGSWTVWSNPVGKTANYGSLEEPLFDGAEDEEADAPNKQQQKSELASPRVLQIVDSLKRTLSGAAYSSKCKAAGNYVALPHTVEDNLSPTSVLEASESLRGSALPSPIEAPTPAIRSLGNTPLPSPSRKTLTVANGKGSAEILELLSAMMSQGLEETELPQGATTMRSAQPKWNDEKQSKTLPFGGLVHQKSVKNMALLVFGEGGDELAHPEFRTQTPSSTRPCIFGGGNLPLNETLIDQEHTYNEEVGRRAFIVGRHKSRDGSEFVCSHDPRSLSKAQAFAIAIASCMKKAVYTYI